MDSKYFYFTLGPVQGFVSQARRTRDFWAGSFLLSWLSGVAMAEIHRQGGKVTFPIPAESYLDWVTQGKGVGEPPRQGSIPNRFKAMAAKVPQGFDGTLLESTVREAWVALAELVWSADRLAELDNKGDSRRIWDRQQRHFWEISWAITEDEAATDLLDRRKNWRSHVPEPEAGVKCMMMDGWQELSGAERPGQKTRDGKDSPLARFWRNLRDDGPKAIATDLREGEHLCAMAYVKRRFVRYFHELDVTLQSGLTLKGWKLEPGMPSVAYMAATHWLETLAKVVAEPDLQDLYNTAIRVNDSHDEWHTDIACLKKAAAGKSADVRKLLALDGNLFFEHVQSNPKAYGYGEVRMKEFAEVFKRLKRDYPELRSAPLSPYYAILLMDGDSLGVQMSDQKKQEPISEALNAFTAGAPKVVAEHNGQLIYAGGDDVLAILPMEDAMTCAVAVRALYNQSFAAKACTVKTSISAAVVFAHVRLPLTQVLTDAHALLDDVAKDQTGRDAIAVRAWNPAGVLLEWSQPWDIALTDGELVLSQLVDQFRALESDNPRFSNKFLFRVRELFDVLNPVSKSNTPEIAQATGKANVTVKRKGQSDAPVLTYEERADLLAVELWHSAENRQWPISDAKAYIEPLLKQCSPVTRKAGVPVSQWDVSPVLNADGALLMRFLANKGVE
ncbi:hypothetical protein WH50_07685 [Pokkaliibacter plantistimulans]|uniref:GGDEF domain-containing protein n=1 Tax=Pokkaliibacter plantistimulans TaxID=1635171 RepID=A0ABX5M293_9GAMM|nr:type III-B CRISPR-associated protein Cas10/Cmr2 [Pokkaliibacter plantistimulans]PXF31853.1 hypothetical protein WH50_07685 [Pokkaliibacter plantistimulans]